MTKPKNTSVEDPDARDSQEIPEEQEDSGNGTTNDTEVVEPEAAAPAKVVAAPTRKPLGAKEVIPFKWKLVGETDDAALTLFKSTDRPEIDAHLERVQKEGYYRNLRVVDVDTKIKQPKPPTLPKKASKRAGKTSKVAKKATKRTSAKTPQKVAEKVDKKAKSAGKTAPSSKAKPTAKKNAAKTAKKVKKTSAPRSPKKRSSSRKKKA